MKVEKIIQNLRLQSKDAELDKKESDSLLNKILSNTDSKRNILNLSKFRINFSSINFDFKSRAAIATLSFVLVSIVGLSGLYIHLNNQNPSILPDEVLESAQDGEIVLSSTLSEDERIREYVEKVGGSFVDDPGIVPNEYTLILKDGVTKEQAEQYTTEKGVELVSYDSTLGFIHISTDDNFDQDSLTDSDLIESVDNVYTAIIAQYSNDPQLSKQWALETIESPKSWEAVEDYDNPNIKVAVLDTGACTSHPDLANIYISSKSMNPNVTSGEDTHGHGCSVAGVIASEINNGEGIAGVSPNISIMDYRIYDDNVYSDSIIAASSMLQAYEDGAQIINFSSSFGTYDPQILRFAIEYITERGVIVVASSGNSATSKPFYPAAYPEVISVGSLDSSGNKSWFSNYGDSVNIYAPGGNVLSTGLNGSYKYVSGTSFSSPYVAGIIANELLLCREPLSTPYISSAGKSARISLINEKYSNCNEAPVFTWEPDPANLKKYVGDAFGYYPEISDKEGDKVTFSVEGPNGQDYELDSDTGVLIWLNLPKGSFKFVMTVSDSKDSSSIEFTVDVTDKPITSTPPVTTKPPTSGGGGGTITYPTGPSSAYPGLFPTAYQELGAWYDNSTTNVGCAASLFTIERSNGTNVEYWSCKDLGNGYHLVAEYLPGRTTPYTNIKDGQGSQIVPVKIKTSILYSGCTAYCYPDKFIGPNGNTLLLYSAGDGIRTLLTNAGVL